MKWIFMQWLEKFLIKRNPFTTYYTGESVLISHCMSPKVNVIILARINIHFDLEQSYNSHSQQHIGQYNNCIMKDFKEFLQIKMTM